jgi:hypothetical protein
MISDEELEQLPADPEMAFVEFEKILRSNLKAAIAKATVDKAKNEYRLEYLNKILAGAKVFNIKGIANLGLPSNGTGTAIFGDEYQYFQTNVDHVIMQIRLRSAQSNRSGSVGLDDTARTKIHHYVQQIRDVIGQTELPDDKRDELHDKLNKFAAEVDKIRTSLQSIAAVYITVCDTIGRGFTGLEPARKWLDSAAALLGFAKDAEERADFRLPAPKQRKQLEAPRPQLPKPTPPNSDLTEEDIPF